MSGWPPLNGPRWIAPPPALAVVPAIVWTDASVGPGSTTHAWDPAAIVRFEESTPESPDGQSWTMTAGEMATGDEPWVPDPRSFSGGDGLTIEVPDGDGIVCGMVWTDLGVWPGDGNIKGNWGDATDPDYPRWRASGFSPTRHVWNSDARDDSGIWGQDVPGGATGWIAYFWYDRSDPRLAAPITNGTSVPMYGWAINVPLLAPRYRVYEDGDTPTAVTADAELTVTGPGRVTVLVES